MELSLPEPAILPWRPFPVDALPEPVRGFVTAGAAAIRCDPSFLALPMLSGLAAAWSKLEGYTPRLALLIHLMRWAAGDPTLADPVAVDAASMAAGVRLSRWFGHEARRVYAMLDESDETRERRRHGIPSHPGAAEMLADLKRLAGTCKSAK